MTDLFGRILHVACRTQSDGNSDKCPTQKSEIGLFSRDSHGHILHLSGPTGKQANLRIIMTRSDI
jgi:hypothetical protein